MKNFWLNKSKNSFVLKSIIIYEPYEPFVHDFKICNETIAIDVEVDDWEIIHVGESCDEKLLA